MALRKLPHVETAQDRIIRHRIKMAKQHHHPVDRTSNYHEALGDLSRSHGVPIDLLLEEWAERAAVREYLGGVSRDEAEFLAMDDVRHRFQR